MLRRAPLPLLSFMPCPIMGAKLVDLPSISVIVTAYNRRRYLPFALRSLEAQTLPRDKLR